ncbi:MAG: HEAT repeat domain-containing protein, partial [Sandaracinaceae bacterium]|nr:HEAT repeat domain-containing protein [Sandaracinaceae bacterium]
MSAGAPVPATREEALRALGTADAEMRRLVVRALERAAPDTARELLPLALGDEDWRVRKEAVHLAQSLAERTEVVPVLIGVLAGPSEHVALRNAAVEALSTLGALAAPPIEQLLSTGGLDADGRKLAIDVLAGARQPRSTRVLVACLDDPDPNVRAAAAEALGLVGGERAIDALVSLLSREDRFLRLVALEGLNRLGGNVPTAQLVALSADKILRHAAITALGRTIDPEALPTLVAALDDPSRHVGESALRAIGELLSDEPSLALVARGGTRGIGALGRKRVLDAVHSEDPALRRAALPVLALLAESAGGDETEALLRALC